MNKVYTVTFSKSIYIFYGSLLILFLGAFVISGFIVDTLSVSERSIFMGTFGLIFLLFFITLWRAKTMRYIVVNDKLLIYGMLRTHMIRLSDIRSSERSPVPSGIRLFGVSFLGGLYYFPGIGKTWVSMANFKKGVLIKASKNRNFFITPDEPEDLMSRLNVSRH